MFYGADDRQAIVGEVPAELVPPAANACALISPSNSNTNLLYRDTLLLHGSDYRSARCRSGPINYLMRELTGAGDQSVCIAAKVTIIRILLPESKNFLFRYTRNHHYFQRQAERNPRHTSKQKTKQRHLV
jgi:hypothetical protein